MLYRDLREFIADLERHGELLRIREQVSTDLEIAAFAHLVSRLPAHQNKALLFENVVNGASAVEKGTAQGLDSRLRRDDAGQSTPGGNDTGAAASATPPKTFPVLMNAYGSPHRLNMMAGTPDYAAMTQKLGGLLEMLQTPRKTLIDKLKALPMLKELAKFFPKYVKRAPHHQTIRKGDAVNLFDLPILKTWPMDAGPFVTLPLVFTKDPETGKRNCGMYRIQRYGQKIAGFHCHTHHTGASHLRKAKALGRDRLEMAIVIGAEPAVTFSAVVPLPPGFDEMLFAGFLNDGPVKMVKCLTVDQEVPASAEIVLEGYVPVDEKRREGPFGDHTGFYSLADDYWVFHCTAITMRADPIYHATVVGPPPQEDSHMAQAIERLFLPLMQQPIHEVIDYALPFEGVAHNLMLCKIAKEYPGQGRKVAHAVWGLGQAMFTKSMLIGDANAPALDDGAAWVKKAARELDVSRDIEMVLGPLETLDHASRALHYGSKIALDLTGEYASEGKRAAVPDASDTPDDAAMLARLRERVPAVVALHTPFKGKDRHLTLVALDKRGDGAAGAGSSVESGEWGVESAGVASPQVAERRTQNPIPNTHTPEPGVRDTSHLNGTRAPEVIAAMWELFPELACAQRVIVFDGEEDLTRYSRLVWLGLNNIDPERDIHFDWTLAPVETHGAKIPKPARHPRRIGVDCTTKTPADGFMRKWPVEQTYPPELLAGIAEKWERAGLPKLTPELRKRLGYREGSGPG